MSDFYFIQIIKQVIDTLIGSRPLRTLNKWIPINQDTAIFHSVLNRNSQSSIHTHFCKRFQRPLKLLIYLFNSTAMYNSTNQLM